MPKSATSSVSGYPIERRIHLVRGQKVMLDSDLAELYSVQTKRLNEAVKRNLDRFPETFMFRQTDSETATMRSQFATSSNRKIKYQPLAFTEHGVVMLSAVLNSPRAIQMSIMVVLAFVTAPPDDRCQQGPRGTCRQVGGLPPAGVFHSRNAHNRNRTYKGATSAFRPQNRLRSLRLNGRS